jgi:hypothetical protein
MPPLHIYRIKRLNHRDTLLHDQRIPRNRQIVRLPYARLASAIIFYFPSKISEAFFFRRMAEEPLIQFNNIHAFMKENTYVCKPET